MHLESATQPEQLYDCECSRDHQGCMSAHKDSEVWLYPTDVDSFGTEYRPDAHRRSASTNSEQFEDGRSKTTDMKHVTTCALVSRPSADIQLEADLSLNKRLRGASTVEMKKCHGWLDQDELLD